MCKKEGDDCHYNITTTNNSSEKVIVAILIPGADDKCRMDGNVTAPSGTNDYRPYNWCIENSIGDNTISIFIIDPDQYNSPNERYRCDSAEFNNRILKHYDLSLEDLRNIDFKINYP